jgi:allantoin racemase
VEALVALRLTTAKRGDFARPLAKRYDGEFARFSPANPAPVTETPPPVRPLRYG